MSSRKSRRGEIPKRGGYSGSTGPVPPNPGVPGAITNMVDPEIAALRSRLDLAIEALREAQDGLLACKTNLLAFGEGHSRCIEEVNRLSNAAGDVWRAIDSALESVAAEIEEKTVQYTYTPPNIEDIDVSKLSIEWPGMNEKAKGSVAAEIEEKK